MWFFKRDQGQSVGVVNKHNASFNLVQLNEAMLFQSVPCECITGVKFGATTLHFNIVT